MSRALALLRPRFELLRSRVDFVTWAAAGLLTMHVVKVATWFRKIDSHSDLPILNVYFVQYYARALRAHEFLSQFGRYWGFDPFEMAGYPAGLFNEVGTFFTSIACHALARWFSIGSTLMVMEAAGFLLGPLLVTAAVLLWSRNRHAGLTSLAVMVVMYGAFDYFSWRHVDVGLWGYQMACFLAVLQVAVLWRWLQSPNFLWWLALTLMTALMFQLHPVVLVA